MRLEVDGVAGRHCCLAEATDAVGSIVDSQEYAMSGVASMKGGTVAAADTQAA
jgi:hypothetical protein